MRDVRVIIVPLRLLRALLRDDHTPPTVAARVCDDRSSFVTLPFYVVIKQNAVRYHKTTALLYPPFSTYFIYLIYFTYSEYVYLFDIFTS